MIDDILQQLINKKTDYFSCNNCKQSFCIDYISKNKICSGIVKVVNIELSYGNIRLCIKNSEYIETYDYTPDEAMSIMSVLSQSIGDWLSNTKAYKKFRKIESD